MLIAQEGVAEEEAVLLSQAYLLAHLPGDGGRIVEQRGIVFRLRRVVGIGCAAVKIFCIDLTQTEANPGELSRLREQVLAFQGVQLHDAVIVEI